MTKSNKKLLLILGLIVASIILFLPERSLAKALADQVRDPMIVNLWRIVLGIVNVIAIIGLIALAVANILRVQIETYNIRRMLPTLVLAIIFANFSHLLCRIGIDFAQVLTNFFIYKNSLFSVDITYSSVAKAFGLVGVGDEAVIQGAGGLLTAIGGFIIAGLAFGFLIIVLLALIIILIPSFLVLAIALLMYVRLYIIWFLVILSPLAFFAAFFEPLKTVWSMWWNWFLKWLMMAPVAFFFLRLAVEVGNRSQIDKLVETPAGEASSAAAVSSFAVWLFGLGMVFFAIYVPFTWGSAVFGALKAAGARGLAGLGIAKKIGAHNIGAKGERWSKSKNPFARNLGRAMQWTGYKAPIIGLGGGLGVGWEARMKAIQSKQQDLAYSGSFGRYVGTPERMATEEAIKANQKREGIPVATDWNDNQKQVEAYLKKSKSRGEMISAISPDLNSFEREGAITYGRKYNQAIANSSRSDIEDLMKTYGKSEVDISKDKGFERAREQIRLAGRYVEIVPGAGIPPVSEPEEQTVTQRVNVRQIQEMLEPERKTDEAAFKSMLNSLNVGDIEMARKMMVQIDPKINVSALGKNDLRDLAQGRLDQHEAFARLQATRSTEGAGPGAGGTPPPPGGQPRGGKPPTPPPAEGGGTPDLSRQVGAVRRDVASIQAELRNRGVPENQIDERARAILEEQERKEEYQRRSTGGGTPPPGQGGEGTQGGTSAT